MVGVASVLLLFFGVFAQANKPVCFEEKKEIAIPGTNFILTTQGVLSNGTQKFANLTLPKGFFGECLITAPLKGDTLVILSIGAKDYDTKNAFLFRLAHKESKVVWSQHIKNAVGPHPPLINEKFLIVPAVGEIISLNPETGGIRWKFGSKETESLDFSKLSIVGTVLHADGVELNVFDGKLVPPKK